MVKIKKYFFFQLLPFANFGIENLSSRYLENYYSFKLSQLTEDDE